MPYKKYKVNLSPGQIRSVVAAIEAGNPATVKLKVGDLGHGVDMLFTQSQLNRIGKAIDQKKGIQLKMSAAQMRAMKKDGGILPILAALAPVGVALLGGVASALGAYGTTKVIGALDKSGNSLAPLGGCMVCGNALAPFGTNPRGGNLFPFGVKDTRR